MIGKTISHYRVLKKIGRGGMGEVFLAEDTHLRRRVALKVIPEELTRDETRRRRFTQEARAAAALEHPHIAAIYDIDEADGRTFIAMEYVRGESLRDAIGSRRFDVPRILELAAQIGEALAQVHRHGIVHRDLKPENILVTEDGYPRIIDFGLAKLTEPSPVITGEDESETQTRMETREGTVMGTVAYMSPEQARGERVDTRSDIFSFGAILFELLTGTGPFLRPTVAECLSAILRDPAPLAQLEERGLPSELVRVLGRALAKNREDRLQSIEELVEVLRKAPEEERSRRVFTRRRVLLGGAVLACAALVGFLISQSPPMEVGEREALTVLVADFTNRTGDAVFDGALEHVLGLGLEGAPFITSYTRTSARRDASSARR